MSHTERGIYITLLCMCWLEGSLPAKSSALAKLVGVPVDRFGRIWRGSLSACFRSAGPGRLGHKRLDHERVKQEAYRLQQAENGRKGGRPRNPSVLSGKGLGSFGLSETKAKKSSSSASSVSDLQSPERTEEKAVAKTPRAHQPQEAPESNLGVITKIAHEAIDIEGIEAPVSQIGDACKSLCAIRGIDYNGEVIRKAVDSALAQRRRSA